MISEVKKKALIQLQKELKELQKDPLATLGVTCGLINQNDYFHWNITMLGPQDTPYAGGLFFLTADFKDDYPNSPPEVKFKNKIYHLNVNDDGHVCISTLNNWVKGTTMSEVLSLIFALFYKVNPNSAYSQERSDLFKNNRLKFDQNVREWTRLYAPLKEC